MLRAAKGNRGCIRVSERARQKSVARFNLDYVVTVAADFEVEQTGAGEVIEASFRLACR